MLALICICHSGMALSDDILPLRVVYDVAVDTPEAMDNVLARASHLSNMTGADPLEGSIVLVLHGSEVAFFTKDEYATYKQLVERARSLSVGGIIKIRISELALKVRGMSSNDIHDFIKIVPFGDAEIARLQIKESHAYLQAHNLAP
ncbi:MAG: DsrE family protein [Gammaproteobacteria bacterium]|nr:DsrE family protein [Gammaproteobacteria bacterium]